jgi:hypothetical protein
VDKRKRGEGENMLGDLFQDNISARAETPGACQTPPCLQWAPMLQVYSLAGHVRALSWAGYVQNM